MPRGRDPKNKFKQLNSPQAVNGVVKSACNIMRRSNCAGAMQYVPELTWILFLRILDSREQHEAEAAEAVGADYIPSLEVPYRWRDWAAPGGSKRKELQGGPMGGFFAFVKEDLLDYLKRLKDKRGATSRQKVISQIMSGVKSICIDTEHNFLDVIDLVEEIDPHSIDQTHVFPLSQVYESLLLKMGEKGGDGGQFFTPREAIRAMVRVVDPQLGRTVYDPACGTGGFLAQSYEYMRERLGKGTTAEQMEQLNERTFYGREKDDVIFPIALANLVLHGIDRPNLWHGNTLTGQEIYGDLFRGAPGQFDFILTNPPFGGKEGSEAQTQFAYKTGSTQVLFLQHVIDELKDGGRCGIVLDEGVLFRNNETAFVQTKKKLLDECDLYCIVSLPGGVFKAANAGVKTNLLFFTKGRPTERVWYYDLSDIKVGKTRPLTLDKFDDFFRLLPTRGDSDRSWTITLAAIEAKNYDLKAVNPNAKSTEDTRTPAELLAVIEDKNREVAEILKELRG